ncbi:MAG: aminopeptidase P family protein [Burkholderiaceae bacterium]
MNAPTSPIAGRIADLRNALARHGLAAFVVPSSDPHLSEYLPERWQGRRWLSGFNGSVGTLIVTRDFAGLWVDSRYWVQAERELQGTGVSLMKISTAAATDHIQWLVANIAPGGEVAIDGEVLSLASAREVMMALAARKVAVKTDLDLLGDIWPDRAGLPTAAVYEHRPPEAPMTRSAKLATLREEMARRGAQWHFISTLDDIAWIFNLRGSDVNFNPVFLAHALLDANSATLFVADAKVDAALQAALLRDGVRVAPYAQAARALEALPEDARLLLDPKRVTLGLRSHVRAEVIEAINPSTLLKSRKSAAEAAQVREAMVQDGVAMCEFYAEFEAALADPARTEPITELDVDARLSAARARRPGFKGLSFGTIAAFNANGAMPHYRATLESHAVIDVARGGLLLIDSGGQYLGGTTDITRVWPIGTVSNEQRRDYTRVLQGTIALSRTRFPRGTLSPMLDAIARAPLWRHGLDYGHGTGHGVGYFLNVHEGPQSISKAIPDATMAMEPGMITSIEPGLYRPGRWGIRIENLVLNVPAALAPDGRGSSGGVDEVGGAGAATGAASGGAVDLGSAAATTEFGEFLEFETLTLCPIDTRCIARALLRADEIGWLNAYHASVRARLSPHVDGAARTWLIERTEPI